MSDPVDTPLSTRIYAWFSSMVTEDYSRMDDLLAHGVPVDVPHPLRHTTALMEATRRGSTAMAEWLLTRGASPVFLCGSPKGTPLHCAIRLQRETLVRRFAEASLTLAMVDAMGRTPLHVLAADAYHYTQPQSVLDLAECLIAQGCPLDRLDHEGLTALHHAIIGDQPQLVEVLLKHGANPNVTVPDTHMSPLGMVALDRNAQLARLLLHYGANPHQPTRDGATPASLFPTIGKLAATGGSR